MLRSRLRSEFDLSGDDSKIARLQILRFRNEMEWRWSVLRTVPEYQKQSLTKSTCHERRVVEFGMWRYMGLESCPSTTKTCNVVTVTKEVLVEMLMIMYVSSVMKLCIHLQRLPTIRWQSVRGRCTRVASSSDLQNLLQRLRPALVSSPTVFFLDPSSCPSSNAAVMQPRERCS